MIAPTAPRKLSAADAVSEALHVARSRLFPFRLDRWLPLGFVSFLDRCGRSGGGSPGGSGQVPGSSSGDSGLPNADEAIATAKDWFAENLVVILAVGAIGIVLLVTVIAIVLWLNSRGVFMYLDNVASGRFDIKRPWREHADRAWSYFGWSFGLAIGGFLGVVALVVPGIFLGLALFSSGASAGPILGIVLLVLLFLVWILALNLFSMLLRDFAAPLQVKLDVRCGQALAVAWGLVRGNLGTFVIYVLLKIVFAILTGITALLAGCFTCCLGFLPVIHHTLLQPFYYFERAWSLCLLRQAGYDLFPPAPAPPPPPEPPAPPAPPEAWLPPPAFPAAG